MRLKEYLDDVRRKFLLFKVKPVWIIFMIKIEDMFTSILCESRIQM